jgi:hypothetical protein
MSWQLMHIHQYATIVVVRKQYTKTISLLTKGFSFPVVVWSSNLYQFIKPTASFAGGNGLRGDAS